PGVGKSGDQSGIRRRNFFPGLSGHSLSARPSLLGVASGTSSAKSQRTTPGNGRPPAGTREHTHGYFASAVAGRNRSGQGEGAPAREGSYQAPAWRTNRRQRQNEN